MRSRPKVKLFLSPGVVVPGQRLLAEAVLTSKSDTPVDFVAIRLRATARSAVSRGRARNVHEGCFWEREWRSNPHVLRPGVHRFKAEFEMLANLPPTYASADASIAYAITVHVSIPWWPDREQSFVVPVSLAPVPRPEPQPRVFVTSREGPRGKNPFMEVSLDATALAVGDEMSGSISVQNLQGKRVRAIDVSFVEMESVSLPERDIREGRRFTFRVLDGAPTEGSAIPFRVRLPRRATPTFGGGLIAVTTGVEVCADVAWGQDIRVWAPVHVSPQATAPRPEGARVAPVGRERQLLVWQNVATKAGLVSDGESLRMHGQRGEVTLEIAAEHREGDYWVAAQLAWPSLGLDLDIGERRWSDALAVDVVKCGDPWIDDRLAAHAREHAQAKAILTRSLLAALMAFEEVKVHDAGARLAIRGSAHLTTDLATLVRRVLDVTTAFDAALEVVPPPAMFAADVAAWEAFAARLRGRLELGRMWIHDAQVGTAAVDIGSVWARGGIHLGSTVQVAIDPPLESPPVDREDPSLSPAARDAWRELATQAKSLRIDADAIVVELGGKLADPQAAMPIVDLAVTLRNALGGTLARGPFR